MYKSGDTVWIRAQLDNEWKWTPAKVVQLINVEGLATNPHYIITYAAGGFDHNLEILHYSQVHPTNPEPELETIEETLIREAKEREDKATLKAIRWWKAILPSGYEVLPSSNLEQAYVQKEGDSELGYDPILLDAGFFTDLRQEILTIAQKVRQMDNYDGA